MRENISSIFTVKSIWAWQEEFWMECCHKDEYAYSVYKRKWRSKNDHDI